MDKRTFIKTFEETGQSYKSFQQFYKANRPKVGYQQARRWIIQAGYTCQGEQVGKKTPTAAIPSEMVDEPVPFEPEQAPDTGTTYVLDRYQQIKKQKPVPAQKTVPAQPPKKVYRRSAITPVLFAACLGATALCVVTESRRLKIDRSKLRGRGQLPETGTNIYDTYNLG